MLIFNNIEGDKYDPFIDQYLVLGVDDYTNTEYNDIDQLIQIVAKSHDELVMVETHLHGLDLICFLENIGKIVIHKQSRSMSTYYVTIQRNLLDSF